MAEGFLIDVRDVPLDVDEVLQAVRHPSQGGAVLFVGMVRDHNDGRNVTRLEYEAYASMARAEMAPGSPRVRCLRSGPQPPGSASGRGR